MGTLPNVSWVINITGVSFTFETDGDPALVLIKEQ